MCYGELCKTVTPEIPILCPECMIEQFHSLTEEDLYEMYVYFIETEEVSDAAKEIFFLAFNKLMLIKKDLNIPPTKGE